MTMSQVAHLYFPIPILNHSNNFGFTWPEVLNPQPTSWGCQKELLPEFTVIIKFNEEVSLQYTIIQYSEKLY